MPKNDGKRWSQQDQGYILEHFHPDPEVIKRIADKLGRTEYAVVCRAELLGLGKILRSNTSDKRIVLYQQTATFGASCGCCYNPYHKGKHTPVELELNDPYANITYNGETVTELINKIIGVFQNCPERESFRIKFPTLEIATSRAFNLQEARSKMLTPYYPITRNTMQEIKTLYQTRITVSNDGHSIVVLKVEKKIPRTKAEAEIFTPDAPKVSLPKPEHCPCCSLNKEVMKLEAHNYKDKGPRSWSLSTIDRCFNDFDRFKMCVINCNTFTLAKKFAIELKSDRGRVMGHSYAHLNIDVIGSQVQITREVIIRNPESSTSRTISSTVMSMQAEDFKSMYELSWTMMQDSKTICYIHCKNPQHAVNFALELKARCAAQRQFSSDTFALTVETAESSTIKIERKINY